MIISVFVSCETRLTMKSQPLKTFEKNIFLYQNNFLLNWNSLKNKNMFYNEFENYTIIFTINNFYLWIFFRLHIKEMSNIIFYASSLNSNHQLKRSYSNVVNLCIWSKILLKTKILSSNRLSKSTMLYCLNEIQNTFLIRINCC